jgi:quinol monooxygenase YgiN
MAKVAIIGTLILKPGTREEALPALLAHRERCLSDEPGTLAFEVLVPADDENKVMFYELYADPAAVDAHMNGTSMRTIQAEHGHKVLSLTGIQCVPAG